MLGRVGTVGPGADLLSTLLPSLQLYDFSEELAAIKSIKTPAETAELQGVADLADEALSYFIEQVKTDIHGATLRVEKMLAEQGARQSIIRLGPGPRFDEHGTTGFKGMSLLCAYVEVLGANGYWVELMRPLALGSLDAAEARHLKSCAEVAETGQALLRPGITGAQIYEAAAAAACQAGLRLDGSCGHGLGIDDQDLPRLVPEDRTVICNHMVVALHPRLVDEQRARGLVIGDTYVLLESGPKRMSQFSSQLITVH
jgi:Xaa-Pro aminopeptidase